MQESNKLALVCVRTFSQMSKLCPSFFQWIFRDQKLDQNNSSLARVVMWQRRTSNSNPGHCNDTYFTQVVLKKLYPQIEYCFNEGFKLPQFTTFAKEYDQLILPLFNPVIKNFILSFRMIKFNNEVILISGYHSY